MPHGRAHLDDLPGPIVVIATTPLVLGATIEDSRDGTVVAARLAAEHPGVSFVGVVAAIDEAHLDALLVTLAPHLAEVIFTAPPGPRGMDPDAASWAALERYGFGQDFVFHVPLLDDAVRYALDALAREPESRWEGTGVLVAGTRDATLGAASAIVDDGRPQG